MPVLGQCRFLDSADFDAAELWTTSISAPSILDSAVFWGFARFGVTFFSAAGIDVNLRTV
jgi:hypothetical protein